MDEVEDILDRSELMLKAAYAGYNQLQNSEGEEKLVGIYNTVTFGRSVTFVLQNIRGKIDGFDDWYANCIEVLKNDPTCNHMVELRNQILKEGNAGVANYAILDGFNPAQLQAMMPSWADGSFIGDQYGGSGFYIERPDGTEEKFYFDFEFDNVDVGLFFEKNQEPQRALDSITDIEDDLSYYIHLMAELVFDAKAEFGKSID